MCSHIWNKQERIVSRQITKTANGKIATGLAQLYEEETTCFKLNHIASQAFNDAYA